MANPSCSRTSPSVGISPRRSAAAAAASEARACRSARCSFPQTGSGSSAPSRAASTWSTRAPGATSPRTASSPERAAACRGGRAAAPVDSAGASSAPVGLTAPPVACRAPTVRRPRTPGRMPGHVGQAPSVLLRRGRDHVADPYGPAFAAARVEAAVAGPAHRGAERLHSPARTPPVLSGRRAAPCCRPSTRSNLTRILYVPLGVLFRSDGAARRDAHLHAGHARLPSEWSSAATGCACRGRGRRIPTAERRQPRCPVRLLHRCLFRPFPLPFVFLSSFPPQCPGRPRPASPRIAAI